MNTKYAMGLWTFMLAATLPVAVMADQMCTDFGNGTVICLPVLGQNPPQQLPPLQTYVPPPTAGWKTYQPQQPAPAVQCISTNVGGLIRTTCY